MSGLVCGISAPPAVKNISSCCPTGHWTVKSNCTQYCTVNDQAEFNSCINGDHDAAGNSSSTPGFYNVLCKDGSASGNETGANSFYSGGVEGGFPSRGDRYVAAASYVFVSLTYDVSFQDTRLRLAGLLRGVTRFCFLRCLLLHSMWRHTRFFRGGFFFHDRASSPNIRGGFH
jgi:hypothetical protein